MTEPSKDTAFQDFIEDAKPVAATPTTDQENPSRQVIMQKRVYFYTELPRACPSCDHKFSEILYKKLYPRRFRKGDRS